LIIDQFDYLVYAFFKVNNEQINPTIVEKLIKKLIHLDFVIHNKGINNIYKLVIKSGCVADQKMVEFRPSTVAISALWCSLDQLYPPTADSYIAYILRLLSQTQKVK